MRSIFVIVCFFLSLSSFASSSHSGPHSEGIAPDHALKDLKTGNQRFVEGKLQHRHQDEPRRKSLATGQSPSAIILSCSDSRVPPELIFDQGLGDVFTVRVAGNVLGAATVASIEYAVEHLGSRLLVVLGHESCGAVKAALTTPFGKSAGSIDLDSLISTIQSHLNDEDRALALSGSGDKLLRGPVKQNVNGVVRRLLTRSKIVRKHVTEGKLMVVQAIYSLESGKVEFWEAN